MGNLFGFGKKEENLDEDGMHVDPKPRKALTITFDKPPSRYEGVSKAAGLYELTGQGKIQLNNGVLDDNDPNYQIMAALEEAGNLSIGQIAERSHLHSQVVEKYVCGRHGLLKDGLVRRVPGQ
jgi:hypothetical protein